MLERTLDKKGTKNIGKHFLCSETEILLEVLIAPA